ncbi:MAG: hypothetical protein R3A52_15590 [Polyangiales bacterium]
MTPAPPPRSLALAVLLALSPACHRAPSPPRDGRATPPTPRPCPTALASMVDRDVDRELWVRPRAIFEHPRLGPLASRSFDDRGELALLGRADRVGFDLRTVDRALLAWKGEDFVAIGMSPFDTRRVADLLWERLLPPRRRADPGRGLSRVEGSLGGRPVAAAFDASCGLAAFAEGDPSDVDRVLSTGSRDARAPGDPTALLRWRARGVPDALRASAGGALAARVRALNVDVDATGEELTASLWLVGALDEGDVARVRAAVRRPSPPRATGRAVGAGAWASRERVGVTLSAGGFARR